MFETLRRERSTYAAEWEMTMMLTASFMGVKSDAYAPGIAGMKHQLEKRLSGQAYSASFVRGALRAKKKELTRDRDLLDRLSALGKEEE